MSATSTPVAHDPAWFRQVLGQYPTGVCIVTAIGLGGRPVGLSVGSFTSVSLDPPLVGFMPDKRSTSWPKIRPAQRFCVNILGAGQEHLCRQFASKAPDKFAGVPWRPAGSGSPVIEGVVAWIDCDLEQVLDAGDHEIVLGRVRDLDLAGADLPLVFFRGGYGGFSPLSLAAPAVGPGAAELLEHLRIVDAGRAEMEAASRDLSGQVVAMSLVGDELVLLASAGRSADASSAPLIGQRIPAVPPIGSLAVAWEAPARIEAWLREADDPGAWRARLAEVRARGWSVTLDDPATDAVGALLGEGRLGAAAELEPADRALLAGLPLDPPGFSPATQAGRVRSIFAPIFGPDGRVSVVLGLASAAPSGRAQLEARVARLLTAAQRVSAAIGGRAA